MTVRYAYEDRLTLERMADAWRPIRARRLAREAAHAVDDHSRCRPQDDCQTELERAS